MVVITLFYQDFKDTFVCNTQQKSGITSEPQGCFIRISKILLYAIHNHHALSTSFATVVLSGFQRYFCMQYTTKIGYDNQSIMLFYQDFKDTFVCNTQLLHSIQFPQASCFIRISKILLYAIHNISPRKAAPSQVVLSGFQRYFCMQYTTPLNNSIRGSRCFIRISKILLYAIHNSFWQIPYQSIVVLSGFQ